MKFDTKVVRAGITPDPTTGSILPPIYETATYVLDEVGRDKGFDYTRSSNPTRQILEDNLAAIESGQYAISFASGMSAVDAALKLLSAGDHLICGDDVYGGVTRHLDNVLSRYGLATTYVNSVNPDEVRDAITPKTRMIWIETPTNPLLKITDMEAMVGIAREHDVLLAVDSTFATPVFLRPLEFGADIVMHSTTKYLSGHNQIIGGVLVTNRKELFDQMKFIQKTIGAVSSPFDCWLNLSGLKTLHLRMKRHEESALQIARFLESHDKVAWVLYPGLPSHPQHDLAKTQMSGFSGMIAFELNGGVEAGRQLMNNVRLCGLAESLGSVETMITHPATMTHADVPAEDRRKRGLGDGLVRLSVGIEDVEDIIQDLEQGLTQA
ncbi:MAG: cystathionine gamma-synthase [Proteobacteria bacterium]|nr:cystathionine gamma-synthase [Pseudomonadota bacterium]MBP11494.1 cystathionine gamma-synthase [Acidiferrobacteraceae bacterium]MDP6136197.1 PLP-dependent aspartate aminotransferase family protein [Arenicellales bacterium]HCF73430.1 cystathionine gamma-synthase [Gammaproteobacteria bacterium]MDP6393387.1 PLP-dependent aspartate aminotransferase family protein [Arenicellales bacterium]